MRFLFFVFAMTILASMALAAEKSEKRGEGGKKATLDLDGVWVGFVVEGKGEQANRGPVHLQLTVEGNQIRAKRLDEGGPVPTEGIYRVVNERMGMIDAIESGGRGRARVFQGIYELKPDEFRWCVTTPGGRRPKTFETRGQQFLLILKRQKG